MIDQFLKNLKIILEPTRFFRFLGVLLGLIALFEGYLWGAETLSKYFGENATWVQSGLEALLVVGVLAFIKPLSKLIWGVVCPNQKK